MLGLMVLQVVAGGLLLEEARTMSPRALADALLPRAGQVERAVVHPLPSEPYSLSISWVDLYSSEIAGPEAGFCERQYTFVNMVPAERGGTTSFTRYATRMRAFEPREETQLRYAGAAPCGSAETGFFPVKSPARASQVGLVMRLVAARERAKGRAALGFALTCPDETVSPPAACDAATARRWLVALPIEIAARVTPTSDATGGQVEVPVEDLFVDATIGVEGDRTVSVALRRRAGVTALWQRSGAGRRQR